MTEPNNTDVEADENVEDDLDRYVSERDRREPGFADLVEEAKDSNESNRGG